MDKYEFEGEEFYWPICAIPGCENNTCMRLNSKYCYPHTNYTGLGVGFSIVNEVSKLNDN